MGCASSKALETQFVSENSNAASLKGISMPSLSQNLPDDFHIVALTSSTYGILKVDAPKPSEEDCRDGAPAANSVKDVLSKLNNLDSKANAGPQSWLEVSSMLENLKPELEKPSSDKKPGGKAQQLEAIDVSDIMLDLDEDTGLVRPKARELADLKKAGKSLPIRTLEELDKRLGGKGNHTKNGVSSPVTSIAEARALLKPVRPATVTAAGDGKSANVSMPPKEERKQNLVMDREDGEIRRDSELVDDDFLQSYKSAMNALSEDEWKVVEALCIAEEDGSLNHNSPDEQLDVICKSLDMEHQEELTSKSSFESEDIFSLAEDEENSSSSTQGSSVMGSSSKDLLSLEPCSPTSASLNESVVPRSPLEDYEELCPPGGKDGVVLYTTSLRSIRRTYEDCVKTREIVKSFGVLIDERDVSMHLEYRNELRELMQRVVTVPRLFVKGRYIGGSEVIVKLAENGELSDLFENTIRCHGRAACDGCAGAKFVPCLDCSGSCKVVNGKKQVVRCPECNENGLIHCPICS